MKKLAVFYHAILDGGAVPINPDFAIEIAIEQMTALKASGLESAMSEMVVGLHGSDRAAVIARALIPAKACLVQHPPGACSEIPTLNLLRAWLPGHEDWYVLYHHIKGVTQPADSFHQHHRRVMQRFTIANWKRCVCDLDRGFDAVGVNWVDPVTRPVLPGRFFAGNFWWATAGYLAVLPSLSAATWDNRCAAESWIGRGPSRPMVLDYERPELSQEWITTGKVAICHP